LVADRLPDKRALIIQIICGCLLLQMWLTPALWWSAKRSFFTIPFSSVIPVSTNEVLSLLLPTLAAVALLLLLVLNFFHRVSFSNIQKLLYLVVALLILLILLDINRLQIWMYQWLLMLLILIFITKELQWQALLQFMLMAIYLWSGLHKLNVAYIDHSFPFLMNAFPLTRSLGEMPLLAIISALLEVGIGIGLFFSVSRKVALFAAIGMHCIILLILGPLGLNDNSVIWPWNVAMMGLLWLLFYKVEFMGLSALWKSTVLAKCILVFWGLFPLANLFGYWDEQLSFKMYSGSNPEGMLLMKTVDKNCFPEALKVYYTRSPNGDETAVVLIDDWALLDMNVPFYISERTLKQLGRQWCSCLDRPEEGALELLRVRKWSRLALNNWRVECMELMKE
jgi:hypothetical protein